MPPLPLPYPIYQATTKILSTECQELGRAFLSCRMWAQENSLSSKVWMRLKLIGLTQDSYGVRRGVGVGAWERASSSGPHTRLSSLGGAQGS